MFCAGEPDSVFCRVGRKVDDDMDIPNMILVPFVESAVDNDGVVSGALKEKYPDYKYQVDYIEEVTVLESAKWILKIAEDAELPDETREKLNKYRKRIKSFQLKYKRLHGVDELEDVIENLELLEAIYRTVGGSAPKMN